MSDKNHDQFIENLLDASLARYSAVTPRAGLEGRILANARARTEQAKRSWSVWAWRMAAGAIAMMILVGTVNWFKRQSRPAQPASIATREASPPDIIPSPHVSKLAGPTLAPKQDRVQRTPHVPVEREANEPRLAVFPSPRPLTKQEELVLQFARATPASALSAFPSEAAEIADLEIRGLEIAPLDGEGTELKNKQ